MGRTEIVGYQAVRQAARDYETYSSDLQGDRDVRDYRQLPLEADPPRHTLLRGAVQPLFHPGALEPKKERFRSHARALIERLRNAGRGDIARDLALPYVIGCLSIIYDRPEDYAEWLGWGPDVWTAGAHAEGVLGAREAMPRDGSVLQAYLDRVFDAAEAHPVTDPEQQDVWDFVSHITIDGQPITRAEMQGIANVLLAGGRDTVIKLVTGLVWHLIEHPNDRAFLAENPDWFGRTVAEMVRYLSPLPKMDRVTGPQKDLPDSQRDPDGYVLLSFVSANHDTSIWPDAHRVDIHRDHKPHLGFGFGPHTCLGMKMTEFEAASLLEVLVTEWPGFTLDGEPDISWAETTGADGQTVRYIEHFEQLRVRISPTQD